MLLLMHSLMECKQTHMKYNVYEQILHNEMPVTEDTAINVYGSSLTNAVPQCYAVIDTACLRACAGGSALGEFVKATNGEVKILESA